MKPIEYISSTNPIVIIDEPQNFETDVRKQALANLNPMCCLRYSATHRNLYNLIYSLNPVQAYDLGLVKQIEVDGIITTNTDYNAAFIQFKSIVSGKKSLKVKLCIYVQALFEVKQKDVLVEIGNDLFVLSGERDIYKHGFELNSINAAEGFIEFSNGLTIRMGETTGGLTDEIMRYQIERTVKHHFDKIKSLKNKQVKVLSLFFIDRVANYRSYDAEGAASGGKFAEWFEAAFTKYQKNNPDVLPFSVETVHNGYFSSDKTSKNKGKNERIWIDSKEKNTQKDDDTYSLIMRDKERLLSLEESLQFIFSHSALREGWDNPNVFQICTLNESKSELKKRQEIGRGLRLPVDSAGQRIHDKRINVLTVIANETYESFSKALQKEIETDTSVVFGDRVGDKNKKQKVVLNKELTLENCPLLFEIWEKISHKTRYSVEFSTEELIRRSVEILKNMPKLNRPSLQSSTAMLIITEDGVEGRVREKSMKRLEIKENYQIPDVYSYIQARVEVTRPTIFQLLMQSDRYEDLEVNPQLYLDNVVAAIKTSLNRLLVEGVKYEIINGQHYEMSLFNDEELEDLLTNLFKVSNFDKTVFNYIPIDSSIERKFAHDCEVDTSVKFFFKLPRGFKIPTPIGNYIPDWAVIFEGDSRIYFVAETKSTLDKDSLRNIETMKIHCGTQHFASLTPQNVTYKMVTSVEELRN